MYKTCLVFICVIFIAACSPVRYVKPLSKREHAVNLSIGGPLFKMKKNTIPMPFLTANYGYGIDSSMTGFFSVNVTSALYGNLQTELGLTKQVMKQKKIIPALSLTPVANILYRNRNTFRFYPQLDINAYWEYGVRKNYFYVGLSNWFELAGKRTLGQSQQNHWFFTPLAGFNYTGKKWNIILETKVIAPNLSNEKLVVEYQTPFRNNGALGVYIGYTRKF